jgi:hypothetical protein
MENIKYKDIDVKIDYENKSVWISQDNISKLFGLSKSTISFHLKKIVDKDIELIHSTVRKIRTVKNGKTYLLNYYNLQIIKFLCYKINPSIASEFIKWVNIQFEENESKTLDLQQKTYEIVTFIDNELQIDVNVDVENDTVWLSQKQLSELFKTSIENVNIHIKNILNEEELDDSVIKDYLITAVDGKQYKTKLYNLDMIISVGYRVKSKRGIMFRKWATSILKNHLTKGYSINEKRCLSCQENLVSLNNEVKRINNELDDLKLLKNPEETFKEKLIYENTYFDGYAFIRKLFLSATSKIIIIDGYVSIEVLEMLSDINIDILIYTYPSATLTNKDIKAFSKDHKIEVVKITNIHDRYIIIDEDVYVLGCSIKDIGKKTSTLIKLNSISKEKILTP